MFKHGRRNHARYGELERLKEIRRLCHRFNLDVQEAVDGMRDFIEDNSAISDALKSLRNCLKHCLAVQLNASAVLV